MPYASIDSLTSPTLKHLRERWWDDEFTEFLVETLRPRPGNALLDVGCGEGLAEVSIGRLHLSQIRLVGVDLAPGKLGEAKRVTAGHNQRVAFAAGDAMRLPFAAGAFDSTYCVAVLQHVPDVDAAIGEFARVTRPGGRVVAVEPDNTARYVYSSVPAAAAVFDATSRLFAVAAIDRARHRVGPSVPGLFVRHGIEPVDVRIFPVSNTILGAPAPEVWEARREALQRVTTAGASEPVRALGRECAALLKAYETEAQAAGPSFVEIQNTNLFGTVGQRVDAA